jgi:hypothetical protein
LQKLKEDQKEEDFKKIINNLIESKEEKKNN